MGLGGRGLEGREGERRSFLYNLQFIFVTVTGTFNVLKATREFQPGDVLFEYAGELITGMYSYTLGELGTGQFLNIVTTTTRQSI